MNEPRTGLEQFFGRKDSPKNTLLFLLLDKLILGGILALVAFWLNAKLDLERAARNSETDRKAAAQRSEEERVRAEQARIDDRVRSRKAAIARQLSLLYRPLKARLQRDTVVWPFFYDEKGFIQTPTAYEGVKTILVPNQLAILELVDAHSDLLANDFEVEGAPLRRLKINLELLEGHVAMHRMLRVLRGPEEARSPIDCAWKWPECLEELTDCRIEQLESVYDDDERLKAPGRMQFGACAASTKCLSENDNRKTGWRSPENISALKRCISEADPKGTNKTKNVPKAKQVSGLRNVAAQ